MTFIITTVTLIVTGMLIVKRTHTNEVKQRLVHNYVLLRRQSLGIYACISISTILTIVYTALLQPQLDGLKQALFIVSVNLLNLLIAHVFTIILPKLDGFFDIQFVGELKHEYDEITKSYIISFRYNDGSGLWGRASTITKKRLDGILLSTVGGYLCTYVDANGLWGIYNLYTRSIYIKAYLDSEPRYDHELEQWIETDEEIA